MGSGLPWDSLDIPSQDLHRRLAAPNMSAPASWAVDEMGNRLFVLEWEGDLSNRIRNNLPKVHGIELELRYLDGNRQMLVFSLQSIANVDLFFVLCKSLLVELVRCSTPVSSVEVALRHIQRWKAFLASRFPRLLSREEVRGLFAELWFFLELVKTQSSIKDVISSWCGPDRTQQDFIYGDRAVEVKSLMATDPVTVRIASENQLESMQPNLFLVIVLLHEVNRESARSLNQIVGEVRKLVIDPDIAFELEAKLIDYGYIEIADYDLPEFEVAGTRSFLVAENFPRIIRSKLQPGVVRVKYHIEIEKISEYAVDVETVIGSMQR